MVRNGNEIKFGLLPTFFSQSKLDFQGLNFFLQFFKGVVFPKHLYDLFMGKLIMDLIALFQF